MADIFSSIFIQLLKFQLFDVCSPYNKENGRTILEENHRKIIKPSKKKGYSFSLFRFRLLQFNWIRMYCIQSICFWHRHIVLWWVCDFFWMFLRTFYRFYSTKLLGKNWAICAYLFEPTFVSVDLFCMNQWDYLYKGKKSLNYRTLHI